MGIVSGLMVYIMIWWVVIFVTLPWGVKSQVNPAVGCAIEAPAKSYIGLKMIITTVLSVMIWWGIKVIIQSGVIQFD